MRTSVKKLFLTFTIALFLFPLALGAQTLSDLEIKIAALFAEIQTLQTELQTLKQAEPTQTPSASVSSSFTTTLGKGSEGSDVTKLQTYLAKDPSLYPEGTISGYFGSLTEAAVKRFQQKHNIVSSGTPLTTGYGTVGPKTRATLNSLLTTTSSTPIPSEPAAPKEPASNGTGPLAQANRSPNLSITGERFVTLPNKVTLTALATDDGLPTNTPASPSQGGLTYLWSKASGEGSVTFSSLTTKTTTATFSTAGTYQITATVSDSDLFASYTIALIVSPASTPLEPAGSQTNPASNGAGPSSIPSLTFTGSKTTLTKGTATTLTWSSANAVSCTASQGWSGSKTASGSTTLTPQTTTTYTLSCKGGGGDQVAKSVTVTVTGTSPAPVVTSGTYPTSIKNPANFHPGYYIMVGQNDGRDAFDSIKNNPDFLGVKKVYLWKNIETAENVYNFSEIEQDLAYLQSIGKRLWLEIGYTEWNGTVSPRVPYYMWNDSKYGGNPGRHGAYQAPSYGSAPKPEDPWYAVIWNTNVQGRFAALYAALGKRFNGEPYLEGVNIGETSMPVGPGYTSSGIDNAFKVNSLAAKKAFPDKVVLLQPNFYDGDISVFRQWLADNGIGIGVPDVVPKSSSITFDFAADFLKLHNQIPTAPDVQWDNYERCKEPPHWSGCTAPGTYFTSVELLEAVVRETNPWYLTWDATRAEFTRDTIPAVRNYGPLPAAREFYNSQK